MPRNRSETASWARRELCFARSALQKKLGGVERRGQRCGEEKIPKLRRRLSSDGNRRSNAVWRERCPGCVPLFRTTNVTPLVNPAPSFLAVVSDSCCYPGLRPMGARCRTTSVRFVIMCDCLVVVVSVLAEAVGMFVLRKTPCSNP